MKLDKKTVLLAGVAGVALLAVMYYRNAAAVASDNANALGAFPYFQTAALPSSVGTGTGANASTSFPGSVTNSGGIDLGSLMSFAASQLQAQSTQAAADTAAQLQEAQWTLEGQQLATQGSFGQSIISAITSLFTSTKGGGGGEGSGFNNPFDNPVTSTAGVPVGTYFQGDFNLGTSGGSFTFGAGNATNPLPFVQIPGSSSIFASTGNTSGVAYTPLSNYTASSLVQANNPNIVLPSSIAVPGTSLVTPPAIRGNNVANYSNPFDNSLAAQTDTNRGT